MKEDNVAGQLTWRKVTCHNSWCWERQYDKPNDVKGGNKIEQIMLRKAIRENNWWHK